MSDSLIHRSCLHSDIQAQLEKAATRSNSSNTNIAPSHSLLLALLNTLSTPPCLSPSVFVFAARLLLALVTIARLLARRLLLAVLCPYLDPHSEDARGCNDRAFGANLRSLPARSISSLSLRRPHSLLSSNHATFRGLTPSSALLEFAQSALPLSLGTAVRPLCRLVSTGYSSWLQRRKGPH